MIDGRFRRKGLSRRCWQSLARSNARTFPYTSSPCNLPAGNEKVRPRTSSSSKTCLPKATCASALTSTLSAPVTTHLILQWAHSKSFSTSACVSVTWRSKWSFRLKADGQCGQGKLRSAECRPRRCFCKSLFCRKERPQR